MRRVLLAIFSAVVLLGATAVYSQDVLWGKTTYGMSVNEVKATVEGAADVSNGGTLHGGAVEKLRLDDVQVVGKSFVAKFYFLEDALVQVTLSPNETMSPTAAGLTFDSLVEALRSRYGQEMSAKNDHSGGMTTRLYSWMSGGTNISLSLVSFRSRDSQPVLGLAYQVRVSKGAENL